jgi:hypothetical protein
MRGAHRRIGRRDHRHSVSLIPSVQLIESATTIRLDKGAAGLTLGFQTACCILGGPASIFLRMIGEGHGLALQLVQAWREIITNH